MIYFSYYVSLACLDLGVWYVPLIWAAVSELAMAILIRDNLTLTIIQLFFNIEWIRKWQARIIPKEYKDK